MSDMEDTDRSGVVVPGLSQSTAVDDLDTFSILVATDNHLGFTDGTELERENDSFNTFEEILTIAKDQAVDFVLLGGDLFHENKPKPSTFHRTVDILQRHCLGSKPVEFEYLGDPKEDFRGQTEPEVNYLNANINIGLPIFTIHGNHDDPVGLKRTSAIDHLAAANLLNHFGQWDTLTEFSIRPLLFKKGNTHLAVYGLGNMKDERLYRLMRDNKVTFLRPEEEDAKWFNIFVLHQNRVKHGPTNYFPESYIPDFMDLVIWGHEHECIIQPTPAGGVRDKTVYIIQPGSSVATSLSPGETADKQVVIIQINKRNFKPHPVKLQTVRPFVFDEVHTVEILKNKVKDPAKSVEVYVQTRVKALIDEAFNKLTGHPKQPTEPLIRIRVSYQNDNEQFNALRFSQQFVRDVANENIVLFRRAVGKSEDGGEMNVGAIQEMIMQTENENLDDLGSHVEEIVERHFANERSKGASGLNMTILSERGLSEAVRTCVEKNDKEALGLIVDKQIKKVIDHLVSRNVTEGTIEDELIAFTEARLARGEQEVLEVQEALRGRKSKRKENGTGGSSDEEESEVVEDDEEDPAPSIGARGRGRGSRGRGRGGAQKKGRDSSASASDSPAKGRGRGRGRGRGAQVIPMPKLPVRAQAPSSNMQFDSSGSE